MNHNGPSQYPSEAISPVVSQEDITALLSSMDDPSALVATMEREKAAAEWQLVNVISGLNDGTELDIDAADDVLNTAGYVYSLLEQKPTHSSHPEN